MKNAIKLTFVAVATFLLTGCPTTDSYLRETGFKLGGYTAASKAIGHHAGNVEAVAEVAKIIEAVLDEEEGILFAAVEEWYAEYRQTFAVDALELELLEELFIRPLWQRLKRKYGGKILEVRNPQVRADLWAFKEGLETAI